MAAGLQNIQFKYEELTVMMSRILSRLWTLSPGSTSFTTGSVPSWKMGNDIIVFHSLLVLRTTTYWKCINAPQRAHSSRLHRLMLLCCPLLFTLWDSQRTSAGVFLAQDGQSGCDYHHGWRSSSPDKCLVTPPSGHVRYQPAETFTLIPAHPFPWPLWLWSSLFALYYLTSMHFTNIVNRSVEHIVALAPPTSSSSTCILQEPMAEYHPQVEDWPSGDLVRSEHAGAIRSTDRRMPNPLQSPCVTCQTNDGTVLQHHHGVLCSAHTSICRSKFKWQHKGHRAEGGGNFRTVRADQMDEEWFTY